VHSSHYGVYTPYVVQVLLDATDPENRKVLPGSDTSKLCEYTKASAAYDLCTMLLTEHRTVMGTLLRALGWSGARSHSKCAGSLGVLLFHLVFGVALWKNDHNDNALEDELKKLAACGSTAHTTAHTVHALSSTARVHCFHTAHIVPALSSTAFVHSSHCGLCVVQVG
jgi:hypothetical protein